MSKTISGTVFANQWENLHLHSVNKKGTQND